MYLAWAFYLFYYMSNLQRCILCVTVAFTFFFSSVNFDSFSTLELGSLNIILHRMFLKQKILVSGISGKEIHQNYELLSWHMTYHVSSMPSRYTVSWNNNLIATLLVLTVIFGPQASVFWDTVLFLYDGTWTYYLSKKGRQTAVHMLISLWV